MHREHVLNYALSFLGIIDLLVCLAAIPTLYEKMLEEQLVNFRYSHAFHVLRLGALGLKLHMVALMAQ